MNTNHPSTTIFFVYAFTFCGVSVYKPDELLLRKLLAKNMYVEILDEKLTSFQEVDSRLLMHLISESLAPVLATATHMRNEADTIISFLHSPSTQKKS